MLIPRLFRLRHPGNQSITETSPGSTKARCSDSAYTVFRKCHALAQLNNATKGGHYRMLSWFARHCIIAADYSPDHWIYGGVRICHPVSRKYQWSSCYRSLDGWLVLTLALAEKYPALLKGLDFYSYCKGRQWREKKKGRRKSIRMMEQYGAETFLRQTLPNMFSPATKSKHNELIGAYVKLGMECQLPALVAYYEAMASGGRTGQQYWKPFVCRYYLWSERW